jgi:hypothetical protein
MHSLECCTCLRAAAAATLVRRYSLHVSARKAAGSVAAHHWPALFRHVLRCADTSCCCVMCCRLLTPPAAVQGGHVPWLLHVVQHCAGHSGMYVIMQAVEEMLGPHHIARLERLTYAALTRYLCTAVYS